MFAHGFCTQTPSDTYETPKSLDHSIDPATGMEKIPEETTHDMAHSEEKYLEDDEEHR